MSQSTPNLQSLFQEAHEAGDITAGSLQVLTNIGAHFAAALGTPADEINASEVTLFNLLADNTGSLAPFVGDVIAGQNLVIDALLGSKQASGIMMSTRYYDSVLNPFVLLEYADRLDSHNYRASLGRTPLYDGSLELLAVTTAKAAEFASNGVPVRTISLIISDGADNSSRHKSSDVAQIVGDLLRAETHIVAGMGIDDGYTDFTSVFQSMGIQDNWILTPGRDPSSIRQAFQVVSQSAVRASQGAGSFSQAALGGFGS